MRSVAGTVRDSVTILADRYPPQTVLRPGRYEAVLVKTMFSGVTLSRALDFRVALPGGGMRNLTTDRRSEENNATACRTLAEIGWCSYTFWQRSGEKDRLLGASGDPPGR